MRRIINFLQSRFSGLNTQDILRPANVITVGPYNCDYNDLSLALQNSLPNQDFFIFGGQYQGQFNLKDGQKFHLFGNPVFIADNGSPLFYALYFNNNANVTVHFIGRGSFIFSSPENTTSLDPNVTNFQLHLDLFIQCTVSQHNEDAPFVDIVNSNVFYHSPGQAHRDSMGVYFLYLLPFNSIAVESSIAIDGENKLALASRFSDPHIFKLLVFDRTFNPSDNFLLDLTLSTKSIANFT